MSVIKSVLHWQRLMCCSRICLPSRLSKTDQHQIQWGADDTIWAGENLLEPNPHWYGGDPGKIKAIQLVEQPGSETSFYSMKTGSLDYLFVDGDETIAETGGSIHYVSMPNLIYIGINDSRTLLSDVRFRQMLAAATDRDGLLETLITTAQETAVPFPASWEQLAPFDGGIRSVLIRYVFVGPARA